MSLNKTIAPGASLFHSVPHSLAAALDTGRMRPSCMTEATSTPRAASHSRPDARPVPPDAAGLSISNHPP